MNLGENEGIVTEIERYAIYDGPGIRTVVFLKGCNLRCAWCANPETQNLYPEMGFFVNKCIGCLKCIEACPYDALKYEDGKFITDRNICMEKCYHNERELSCVAACPGDARVQYGKIMTVEEILEEVLKDKSVYDRTGGGVTLSGGEPFFQKEFMFKLLKALRANRVRVAIETSGFTDWENINMILDDLDFIYYDIKSADPVLHRKFTGGSNDLVLENVIKVSEYAKKNGLPIIYRIPVIPNFNDSKEEIEKITKFIKNELYRKDYVELLSYHTLGLGKYESLERDYSLTKEKITKEKIKMLKEVVSEAGLKVL
ncbi:MAG: isethionate sulfite-lyase activating enzyme [Halanaerobiales bacterium]|nr:isethionate sulfite-lyase activating enzyme [Halanaerobiales bacterium]